MSVATYSKSGVKASAPAKLDKAVFSVDIDNHDLLKQAYVNYMARGRSNYAVTKKRGDVRGGGIKPWRQKGTGRARFGSSRNPIWRGGGVAFGPTGNETYAGKLNQSAKRQAIKQALTLAAENNQIKVIETFACADGKVKPTVQLLNKIEANKGNTLLVVSEKDSLVDRATRNVENLKAVSAKYLNVFDILNADNVVISKQALDAISEWLGESK